MKEKIVSANAPAAIGPYSQGTAFGDMVFTSGQLPIDPSTGVMPEDIKEQTLQSLKNVAAVLDAVGSDVSKALKVTVFLKDMNDFVAMNEVYADFFGDCVFPARSAIQVARLPKDALVEIEVIAAK